MSTYRVQFGDNAKICGDFVVANTIQESFNKVQSSKVSTDLKKNWRSCVWLLLTYATSFRKRSPRRLPVT